MSQTRYPLTQVILPYLITLRDQAHTQSLVTAPKDELIQLFRRCFHAEPRPVVEAWLNRKSDFEFMEHTITPRSPVIASLLSDLLRKTERLYELVTRDVDSEGYSLKQAILSEIEQEFVQALIESPHWQRLIDERALADERILNLGEPAKVGETPEAEAEVMEAVKCDVNGALRTLLCRSLESVHEVLTPVICRSAYSDLPYEQGRYSLARALDEFGAYLSFEQVAEQSKATIERKWGLRLDDMWITDHLNSSELSSALIKLRAQWVELWSGEVMSAGLNTSLSVEERRAIALNVWESVAYDHCFNYARRLLHEMRAADIRRDLCVSFEALIDKRRPKAQQLAAFMMNPEDDTQIDVVFLTRDGRYLAQRSVEWDPTHPAMILEAFDHINVSTLICATETSERFPEALKLLEECYTLRLICASAFEAPADGSGEEVKSFLMTIGGCDVAPLRFWIRADLERLITALTSREIFRSLEESDSVSRLHQELSMMCAQRWLALRRKRTLKGKKANLSVTNNSGRTYDRVEHRCEVGDTTSVTITHVSGRTLSVVTPHGEGGHIDLSRSEWIAFGYAQDELNVGATLYARVFEIHPVTGAIRFILESTMTKRRGAEVHEPKHEVKHEVKHDRDHAPSVIEVGLSATSYLNYISYPRADNQTHRLGTAERLNALFKL